MLKIAHRGSHHFYPENTLEAIEDAIKLNADCIEIDARVCQTGEFVIHHDANLKRLIGVNQKVEKTPLSELNQFRFKADPSVKIPKLIDVLDLIKGKVQLNIEFKAIKKRMNPSIQELRKSIIDLNLSEDVFVSSFNPLVIKPLQSILKLRTAFLFDHVKFIPLIFTEMLNVEYWNPNFKLVDENLMSVANKRQKKVFPWTVNSIDEITRLQNLGVDGIITDDITLFNKLPLVNTI